MPRAYPSEFRERALALVKAGRSVVQTASDLEITQATIYAWIKQERIDRGERPGVTTKESKELRVARRRIRELEAENEILRRAHELLGPGAHHPKGFTR
jgi:transposase